MNQDCKNLRKNCLRYSYLGKDGNLQSVFSSMEVIYTLYLRILDLEQLRTHAPERDKFFLSKGQSNLGLMAVLESCGLLQKEEMENFCGLHSRISMQADYTKLSDVIENSAGSLGHGLPMAVGAAMAGKIKGLPGRIFCLVGDGECNEGTVWEACMLAADQGLDNLCVIMDWNHSLNKMLDETHWAEKFEAFGFDVSAVDGHDVDAIEATIMGSQKPNGRPKLILADTKRGYGSPTLMQLNEWFHKHPDDSNLQQLMEEVDSFA